LIGWIVTASKSLSNASGIISFFLNLLIILFVLYIIFKIITGGDYYERVPAYRLFVNVLFYIPCLFVPIFDKIFSLLGFIKNNTKDTPSGDYNILGVVLVCYIVYFWLIPIVKNKFEKQGGNLLVNYPTSINTKQVIGAYDILNKTAPTQYEYQYAISFWLYLESQGTNANTASTKYTEVLDYGGKPKVQYNVAENKLMITMKMTNSNYDRSATAEKLTLDENGDVVLCKMENILLQKWNNIIFNYNNGTVDIFYNGQLVKTVLEVVPKMSKDALTIGENSGINGGICNVNYFNKNLTMPQIYYLYNTVKDNNPPVIYSSSNAQEEMKRSLSLTEKVVDVEYPELDFIKTIPINIDIKDVSGILKGNTGATGDSSYPGEPTNKFSDYLSQSWYFNANGDKYTGI
jgi:hypothetical protein